MSGQTIRAASADDAQALAYVVLKMLSETEGSEGVERDKVAERLKEDGPGGKGLFDCLIGFHRARPSGLLMYSHTYDPYSLSAGAQVQTIYVTEAAGADGLAEDLVNGLFHIAAKQKWSHIDWPVDRTDSDAVAFFKDEVGATCGHYGFRVSRKNIENWIRSGRAAA
ncbi:MAG: hypothetical protein LPL00_12620 [Alphaproteobacteria bacterium]|nr:hypothetical protein [Alphaproteobacteria bacterium]MDX5370654.1 hypothetical protein [Alphaproteobacteria bacterium]MDX5465091.1 hypothetical protein [Alphaproteobacteria bacterium]